MIIFDFESRSTQDLKKVGAYCYAQHPSTEVMCLSITNEDGTFSEFWNPHFRDWSDIYAKRVADRIRRDVDETPPPEGTFERIAAGEFFEAHNAFFERCLWRLIMVQRWGWPDIPDDQWVCSAALAASYALRPKLDHAIKDLRLPQEKDDAGHKLMMKMCQPKKTVKWEREVIAADNLVPYDAGWDREVKNLSVFELEERGYAVSEDIARYRQTHDDLQRLFAYCRQDVVAERGLSQALRPLSKSEQKVWELDQKINWRGLHCDAALVQGAIKVGAACDVDSQIELSEITNDRVGKVTQRDAMKKWLKDQGTKIPTKEVMKGKGAKRKKTIIETTEADAMQEIMDREEPAEPEIVRRACEIWIAVNKTSTAKYRAIERTTAADGRVHGTLRYHGASTGRWGGQLIQPHNFPRKCPKDRKGIDKAGDAMDRVCQDVTRGNYDEICMLYGRDNVMTTLSSILRGAITPAPGYELLASDYSAIEARGTFWISGHEEGLEVFRKIDAGEMPGQDIYTWQASEMHGRTIFKSDDAERQNGKVVILGCGYGMGGKKLVSYAEDFGVTLTEERAFELVDQYRDTNWPVVEFWRTAQKCATEAIRKPGVTIPQGRLKWRVHGRFLHCRLPSGRLLSYMDPKLAYVDMPWSTPEKPAKGWQIQYWGIDTFTRQWKRTSTYGGKICENIVQALCRDLMAAAMFRAENAGYSIILTVHDEIVAEVLKMFGSVEEFNRILSVNPQWADGFPIVAEGWRGLRYRK